MKRKFAASLLLLALLPSCRKDKAEGDYGDLRLTINFNADGQALSFDTLLYTHPAGYKMSFSRAQFYLSGFTFYKTSGEKITSDLVWYADARKPETLSAAIHNISQGDYKSFACIIGLDDTHNQSHFLGTDMNNQNMEWPEEMGGGYHFIKLEGNYLDNGSPTGYAMHIGMNENRVGTGTMNRTFHVQGSKINDFSLRMNLMEWFKNPAVFDFNKDGNFIMGNQSAMHKFSLNGIDVLNQ